MDSMTIGRGRGRPNQHSHVYDQPFGRGEPHPEVITKAKDEWYVQTRAHVQIDQDTGFASTSGERAESYSQTYRLSIPRPDE